MRKKRKQTNTTYNETYDENTWNDLLDKYPNELIEEYSSLISSNKHNSGTYVNRGIAYLKINNIQAAIDDFEASIHMAPSRYFGYYNLGIVYLQRHEFQKSLDYSSEAIKRNPAISDAYQNRAVANRELGNNQAAIDDYTRVLKKSPEKIDIWFSRASLFAEIGKFENAIDDYTKIISTNIIPISGVHVYIGDAYCLRGMMYEELKNVEKAFSDFSNCIKINNKSTIAHFNRGCISFNLGNDKDAVDDFTIVLSLDAHNHKAFYYRGACYKQLGENSKAIKDFEKAVAILPSFEYREILEQTRSEQTSSKWIYLGAVGVAICCWKIVQIITSSKSI